MDTDSIIQLIAIVILLVLSAFFSSAETSFITVNRIKVLSLVEEGNKRAALVIKIIDQPAKMLSAVLIGNNIVNISCSALATSFTISVWGNKATGIVTGVLTLLVLIFGEITPKNTANMYATNMAMAYAPIIWVLMIVLTPFGHAGERTLNSLCPMGFAHYKQSIRVVELLEKDGKGLNLTWEVRDGIVNHRTSGNPSTLEGKAVRLSDKIAYINHDIDDGIRAGILKESDIPSEYTYVLGNSTKERLNTMISDIVVNSLGKNDIVMSEPVHKAMTDLRKFMFESLYLNPTAKSEEAKADKLITELYRYYVANTDKLPDTYKRFITEFDERPEQVVCDYIAGMSDQYSISKFQEIFVPKAWKG